MHLYLVFEITAGNQECSWLLPAFEQTAVRCDRRRDCSSACTWLCICIYMLLVTYMYYAYLVPLVARSSFTPLRRVVLRSDTERC